MLALYITNPWPNFYSKGMKTWEVRSYPIDYRGDILLINAHSNTIICKMKLLDCITLTKERWEMNYEKHRISCSYETLPYRGTNSPAYAWILSSPVLFENTIHIKRTTNKPYFHINENIFDGHKTLPIIFKAERIACKFLGDTMFLYWMKKNYFALISITNLVSNNTQIITSEIDQSELDYVISQINAL